MVYKKNKVKFIFIFFVSLLISCENKNTKVENGKTIETHVSESDTIIVTMKSIDSTFQKISTQENFIIQKNEKLSFVKVLNRFYKKYNNIIFTPDSNSVYDFGKCSNTIDIIGYFQYHSTFVIYNYDSIGAIYMVGNELIGEEYFISYHSSFDTIWLDSVVNSLREYNLRRKEEMFPVIEE